MDGGGGGGGGWTNQGWAQWNVYTRVRKGGDREGIGNDGRAGVEELT